jgi:transposase
LFYADDGVKEDSGVLVRQVGKRRSVAEKRQIVEQIVEPGASVAHVGRAHGLNANVVFHWRGLYREGKLTALPEQAMKLLPVSIAEHEVVQRQPEEVVPASCGAIYIELPGEVRISVEGRADPAARASERGSPPQRATPARWGPGSGSRPA